MVYILVVVSLFLNYLANVDVFVFFFEPSIFVLRFCIDIYDLVILQIFLSVSKLTLMKPFNDHHQN